MSKISSLLHWDFINIKHWFIHKRVAKILVITAFIFILLIVAVIVHFYSFSILSYLSLQEKFGLAIGDYFLATTFFVVLVVGVISTAASSLSSYFSSRSLSHLISLPLSPSQIFWSKNLQTITPSSWPIFIILIPVLLAYLRAFPSALNPLFIIVFVLLLTTLLIHAIGSAFSFALAAFTYRFRPLHYFLLITLLIIFISPLVRFLVPLGLKDIYHAENLELFKQQLYSLPIFAKLLPSNWIWPLISFGYWNLVPSLLLVILSFYTLLHYLSEHHYLPLIQKHQNKVFVENKKTNQKKHFLASPSTTIQIIQNDLYALFLTPKETSYAVFIIVLFLVLTLVSHKLPIDNAAQQGWFLFAVSVVWFGFFSLIILVSTRFIFPLMQKEYESPHVLFASPISKTKILLSKILSSLLIILLPTIIGAYTLLSTKIFLGSAILSVLIFLLASFSIAFIQFAAGTSYNSEIENESVDAASTSSPGIIATIFSFAVMFIAIYAATTEIQNISYFSLSFIIALGLISLFLSRKSLTLHQA